MLKGTPFRFAVVCAAVPFSVAFFALEMGDAARLVLFGVFVALIAFWVADRRRLEPPKRVRGVPRKPWRRFSHVRNAL
jgi:H+/Cl- antiporter ClcA